MPTLAPVLTMAAAGVPRQLEEDTISKFFSALREYLEARHAAEAIRSLVQSVQQHYWWAALVVVIAVVAVWILAMYAERYEKKRHKKKGYKKKGHKKK